MPSESALLLDRKLGATRRAFHSALVSTSEQLRSMLATKVEGEGITGLFSNGYVNSSSFSTLAAGSTKESSEKGRLQVARDVLLELIGLGDDLYRVEVAPGAGVRCAVSKAYGRIGRAFAAARAASNANSGNPAGADEAENLKRYNYSNWSVAERNIAPGLLIEVAGKDLLADGLSEFLDGNTCLAFMVSGASSPAPLVGLIRPGVFVAQSKTLDPFGMPDRGPATVAVLAEAEGAATFTHQPAGHGESGMGIWSRLTVSSLPETAPESALGSKSANQQREELRQLAALSIEPLLAASGEASTVSQEPGVTAALAATSASGEPIDRLAAWLLSKAK